MNLHEYQAKQLFAKYGLPVPEGKLIKDVDSAEDVYHEMGNKCVLKVQIHAGGRGKSGGVTLVNSAKEVKAFAQKWLGQRMVTYQTDAAGQPVDTLLLEPCSDIAKELYFSAVVDRSAQRIIFIASTEGGVEIEQVAKEQPHKIIQVVVDPLIGARAFQGQQLAQGLGLDAQQTKQFIKIFISFAKLFEQYDLSMLEINPLVITGSGELLCLDAKVNVDDNAAYRHKEMFAQEDTRQRDAREVEANQWQLSYVALDGDIGCMVNGAGLAMGTMDMIKLHGGEPANFLDVGGSATAERVAEAFRIILSEKAVRSVLVNIFGGIVRCDLIAEGIIQAVGEIDIKQPVIVRLAGNRAPEASELLKQSTLDIIAADDLNEAARLAVEATQ